MLTHIKKYANNKSGNVPLFFEEEKMSNARIRFGLNADQLKDFTEGREVSYCGVNSSSYGIVTIDVELDDIKILKPDGSHPTVRRRTPAEVRAEKEARDPCEIKK
ncbi:MAG: hypothetical protein NT098_01445 [Candidatus Parcubacteria bacterium]|nr:hypothetical protein [Candidatus Parcubacteria bacterium]